MAKDLKRTEGDGENQLQFDLAPGTKKKIRDLTHVLFEQAIRYEWASRNPITEVWQGSKRLSAPQLLTIEELSSLLFKELELRERVMIFLDFGTGRRRGELSGLKWEDCDFEKCQIVPRRPVGKMKGQQPYWLSRIMHRTIKPIKLAAEKLGIQLKEFHTLRHTYCRLLDANGNDTKVVQERLQHASLNVTTDVYMQALTDKKQPRVMAQFSSGYHDRCHRLRLL